MPRRMIGRATAPHLAISAAATLLAAGCGGGSQKGTQGSTSARTTPAKPGLAAVAKAAKAQLEAPPVQLKDQTTNCQQIAGGYTCRVRGIVHGQPRSGTVKLTAQDATGTRFLAAGRLAGPGGHVKFSGLAIDLAKPPPTLQPPAGRSSLENEIALTLNQRDPQLSITTIHCPAGKTTGAGAHFTCTAQGQYVPSQAVVNIRVTQIDAAGRRFKISGTIETSDRTGQTGHGSFHNLTVIP